MAASNPSTVVPSKLRYQFTERSLKEVLLDPSVKIPEHQRPEMWNAKRQERLIETVMNGHPMPNITYREEVGVAGRTLWLEDGQQRYLSLKKFFENRLAWRGRTYKDLTEDERIHFLTYKVPILTYSNATIEETIQIFDVFQNGVALTPGQRFHARLETPLVRYARERLLTPGQHFHARASAVWGPHQTANDTKTKRVLMNAMAIAGGAAHGVPFITTSYDILGPVLTKPFDLAAADELLDHTIRVFEQADARAPITQPQRKKQWNVGTLTGYILATFIERPTTQNELARRWVDYIVGVRQGTYTIDVLYKNMPESRNWTAARWRQGIDNLFGPAALPWTGTGPASARSSFTDDGSESETE